MKNLRDFKHLKNTRVLLRLDLNVPLKDGFITDETRIIKIIPILKYLIKENAKVIIISHVGRPKGKINPQLSLKPIKENLENKLSQKIHLISDDLKKIKNTNLFEKLSERIIFFENIRFYKEEENNDLDFSRDLASLADIYINDAFSCSHRNHASVTSITEFLPSYPGIQLISEIEALEKVTNNIEKPVTCIMGGSKISTKIGIIKNLIPRFNNIIIVGGMANNILNYKNFQIGKSIQETKCGDIIKDIFNELKKFPCSLIYPKDVIVGKNFNDKPSVRDLNKIKNDEMILDIGPKTIEEINDLINKSKTVLWNGPAGYCENPDFAKGSIEIAKSIIRKSKTNSLYSVAGGGDTIALLNKLKAIENFDFVSTAGGAFLEYLEGKDLPGIKALKNHV